MAELTEKDLLEQVRKVQEEAKEIRLKNLASLGELTVKFLHEEISLEELKTFAINHNFLNKKDS